MERQYNDEARGGNRGLHESRNGSSERLVSGRDVTTKRPARQYLHGANGRVVAWLKGDCLCKEIDGSKHILHKPHGIAFDRDILDRAKAAGAVRVWVRDRESGDVYRAELAAFWRSGVELNRGYGEQVALPMAFWHAQRGGESAQLPLS